MKLTRRDFVHAGCTVAAASLVPNRVDAAIHGSSSVIVPTRVLLAGYGQSNMGTFSTSYAAPGVAPNANLFQYDGTSTTAITAVDQVGDAVTTCMNQVNNATGLPVLFLKVDAAGTPITGLIPGTSNYAAFITQISAVMLPTDYVVVLYVQGEGDTNPAPPEQPQTYIDNLRLIRDGIASSLGLPNIALLTSSLGTVQVAITDGQPTGGSTQDRWQRIRNAQFFSETQIPHVYFSGTNFDVNRGADPIHYTAPTLDGVGQRFAQGVTTLMGHTSGFAHWEISNAATVDATHTNVNLVHSLGTDFTPTTNADGWEVSGDNGASWAQVLGTRTSPTQLQLTHSGISTTSARLVRYQWGYNQAGNSEGPTPGLLRDNSALTVPLTPSTWDIRPNGASSIVPCATWRNISTASSTPNTLSRDTESMYCFPSTDNYQKFIILAMYSGYAPSGGPAITLTVTPLDVSGNGVGSPVTATLVGDHTTAGMSIFQVLLGTDANAATNIKVNVALASDPFTNFVIHVFDVPFASLSSTTNTGTNSATTTLVANTPPPGTSNCTVNVSAGGMIISMNSIDITQGTAGVFATYSSNFNNRWEDGGSVTLDAANSSADVASPFTINFGTTNQVDTVDPINMYTFMASWR